MSRKIFWLVSVVLLWTISALSVEPLQAQYYIPYWDSAGTFFDSNIWLDPNNNVGIGTQTPTAPLHVSGDQTALRLESVSQAPNVVATTKYRVVNGSEWHTGVTSWNTDPIRMKNKYFIRDQTALANRVVVDSDGNVGIGNDFPGAKLTVAGTGSFAGGLAVSGLGSFTAGVSSLSTTGTAIKGQTSAPPGSWPAVDGGNAGVHGRSTHPSGIGVIGEVPPFSASGAIGVLGKATPFGPGWAGWFHGKLGTAGGLVSGATTSEIDHPLDPANKYLRHASVQSDDLMNIYNGNVILDASGEAVVTLPDWFGALNRDYRYQLTSIGGFAPVYIAEKIRDNRFKIAGGQPGMEVSWQVTGIRQDAMANAVRKPVEEEKSVNERGYYVHPTLFGQPEEKSLIWASHPDLMRSMKADQEKDASSEN